MLGKMPREVRQRVEEESVELNNRIRKLKAFLSKHQATTTEEANELKDLNRQLNAMTEYGLILEKRLADDDAKPGNSWVNASIYDKFVKDVRKVIDDMASNANADPNVRLDLCHWIGRLEEIIPKEEV